MNYWVDCAPTVQDSNLGPQIRGQGANYFTTGTLNYESMHQEFVGFSYLQGAVPPSSCK